MPNCSDGGVAARNAPRKANPKWRPTMTNRDSRIKAWDQLEGAPAAAWIQALQPFETGDSIPLSDEMLFVYERSAPKAENEDGLAWAEVAVRAADLDAAHALNQSERESSLWKAMRMRSNLSVCWGRDPGTRSWMCKL